jgi:hypothetical protein
MGLQKDSLDSEQYFEQLGLPYVNTEKEQVKVTVDNTKNEPQDEGGRPPFSRDLEPRKQRRVLPRSGEPTSATLWGIEAQEKISEMMTPVICEHYKKKDARALSKVQTEELEGLKLSIFTSLEPMIEVNEQSVQEALARNTKPSKVFKELVDSKRETFNTVRQRKPNTSEMRHIYASSFAEIFCNNHE